MITGMKETIQQRGGVGAPNVESKASVGRTTSRRSDLYKGDFYRTYAPA